MGAHRSEAHDQRMTTLHIEVTVNDIDAFRAAFGQHAALREDAGVCAERVQHEAGDDEHLVIDLEFESSEAAEGFLGLLREVIWPAAPALVGTPEARILEPLDLVSA